MPHDRYEFGAAVKDLVRSTGSSIEGELIVEECVMCAFGCVRACAGGEVA